MIGLPNDSTIRKLNNLLLYLGIVRRYLNASGFLGTVQRPQHTVCSQIEGSTLLCTSASAQTYFSSPYLYKTKQ